MKFELKASWRWDYKDVRSYYKKVIKKYRVKKFKGRAVIEINTLEELINLKKDVECELIIGDRLDVELADGLPQNYIINILGVKYTLCEKSKQTNQGVNKYANK